MLDINTITKIFNTGFTRMTPSATSTSQITWDSLGASKDLLNDNKTINKSELHQEYVTVLEKMFESRANYYKSVDSIAYTDKTLEIVDQLIDEILNAVNAEEPFTPVVLETEPYAREILQACKELNYNCDVYRYDRDMIKKLIIYGEYILSTSVKVGRGVTEINDLVESKNIIPLYKGYKIKEYFGLLRDLENNNNSIPFTVINDKVRIDKNLMTHFVVSPNRYPLSFTDVPELIHKGYSTLVGVSVLYPALSRLYKLAQLDAATDFQALDQASKQLLVGIPVGANVKPSEYPELTRTYVNFLQPILGPTSGNSDYSNILNTLKSSGGFQILPYPQGEGKPEAITFPPSDSTLLLNRKQELNNSIDKTLGLDNSEGSRQQVYAMKARLVKRLQDVLKARKAGWREIYLRHITLKGIPLSNPMNFDVQMAALPDYDVFAEAEGISHLITSLRDIFGFTTEVTQTMNIDADIDCLINGFDNYVGARYPVFKGLFSKRKEETVESPEGGQISPGGTSGGDFANVPPSQEMPEIEIQEQTQEQVQEPTE